MPEIQDLTVAKLRSMAQEGNSPSQILREMGGKSSTYIVHTLDLIQQMRMAFGISLSQAKPIAGWVSGELNDSALDALLLPALEDNRPKWEGINQDKV